MSAPTTPPIAAIPPAPSSQEDSDAESSSSPTSSTKHRRRSAAKCIWLLTYRATSPSIDRKMMEDAGGLSPTECHTLPASVEGYKITFVKLLRRVREKQVQAFMRWARIERRVECGDDEEVKPIIGAERNGGVLANHPDMRRIRLLLAAGNPASEMESWTESVEESTSTRLLKRFKDTDDRVLLTKYTKAVAELSVATAAISELKKKNSSLKADLREAHAKCQKTAERQKKK